MKVCAENVYLVKYLHFAKSFTRATICPYKGTGMNEGLITANVICNRQSPPVNVVTFAVISPSPSFIPVPLYGQKVARVKLLEKWRYLTKYTFSAQTFNRI